MYYAPIPRLKKNFEEGKGVQGNSAPRQLRTRERFHAVLRRKKMQFVIAWLFVEFKLTSSSDAGLSAAATSPRRISGSKWSSARGTASVLKNIFLVVKLLLSSSWFSTVGRGNRPREFEEGRISAVAVQVGLISGGTIGAGRGRGNGPADVSGIHGRNNAGGARLSIATEDEDEASIFVACNRTSKK